MKQRHRKHIIVQQAKRAACARFRDWLNRAAKSQLQSYMSRIMALHLERMLTACA